VCLYGMKQQAPVPFHRQGLFDSSICMIGIEA